MSQEDAWREVAHECPVKIMQALHEAGHYVHCTSARFPGKILCIRGDSELPVDWQPTEAQEAAWEQSANRLPPARQA
jgi:hypothetical protein